MLQGEHSAILSTFLKLSFAIKIFVLSIFEWPLKTGFTVVSVCFQMYLSYDFASGSDITPCIKNDKPLVVYRFW